MQPAGPQPFTGAERGPKSLRKHALDYQKEDNIADEYIDKLEPPGVMDTP
jgi:hypothetical protein